MDAVAMGDDDATLSNQTGGGDGSSSPTPPPPSRAAKKQHIEEPTTDAVEEQPVPVESATTADESDMPVENEKRRPSPPSFLKTLGDELQLDEPIKLLQSPNQSFHYSKQHTGLKNLSFNVGAAVMPSAKMQFDQEPESFGVVKINRPTKNGLLRWEPHRIIGRRKGLRFDLPDPEKLMMSKSVENLAEQGYLDLKYYHNKLW